MQSEKQALSNQEMIRYARHLALPGFDITAQQRLKDASVLVVGAGGLGCPLLMYLAAAGVGHIGIIDFDVVEPSNLQRQVLFGESDIGHLKAECAKARLQEINPHIHVTAYPQKIQSDNALDLIRDYDIVADGTDNFPTRYLINDACVLLDKINVFASIFRYEGQIAVFNYPQADGSRGPNYRHLFPQPPPPEQAPNCAEAGVMGVLPGIIGSIQASEIIKVITRMGEPLDGKLFVFDLATFANHTIRIPFNPHIKIEQLIDYEDFCQTQTSPVQAVKSISPGELKTLLEKKENIQLLDIREPYEQEIVSLGGPLIDPSDPESALAHISEGRKTILYCRSGRRSREAILQLEDKYQLKNLYNLKGGILAYIKEVEPDLPAY